MRRRVSNAKWTGVGHRPERGFLVGVVRKRLKLKLDSKKVDGEQVYAIAPAAAGQFPQDRGHQAFCCFERCELSFIGEGAPADGLGGTPFATEELPEETGSTKNTCGLAQLLHRGDCLGERGAGRLGKARIGCRTSRFFRNSFGSRKMINHVLIG